MMKKLKRILNTIYLVLLRIVHVFEHVICDDVPRIDDKED